MLQIAVNQFVEKNSKQFPYAMHVIRRLRTIGV
jgi:hypothetical protein